MKNKIKKVSQYVFSREKETPSLLEVLMKKHIKECEERAAKTITIPVDYLFKV